MVMFIRILKWHGRVPRELFILVVFSTLGFSLVPRILDTLLKRSLSRRHASLKFSHRHTLRLEHCRDFVNGA